MQLIQFEDTAGQRHVGRADGDQVEIVTGTSSVRELALTAIRAEHSLATAVEQAGTSSHPETFSTLLTAQRVLPPLDHADSHHCLITGTGLTHTGSADTRDSMHTDETAADDAEEHITDSMQIFRWGLQDGHPPAGEAGAQPEWFYKGDGSIVTRPHGSYPAPTFGEDFGEEPEIAGLYVIGDDRRPYRLGYALANEASDHVMERRNYLYLAHSKLRHCSFGPTLLNGELPEKVEGTSRIWRNDEVLWEKPFLSGQAHMCHSLENLEYHHFKYAQFLHPGDVHVHFFGTATLSFADHIRTQAGDRFEIACPLFGPALQNTIGTAPAPLPPGSVRAL